MGKDNLPENNILCINQAYLTIQKSQNIFHGGHFILGQVLILQIKKYVCGSEEVKIYRLLYNYWGL